MKKYDQSKLSSIIARITRECQEFIEKYSKIATFMLLPILMEAQDTVACITGIRYDGVHVAFFGGNEYVVKYRQEQAYFVVWEKIVFIKTKTRNRHDKVAK